MKWTAGGDALSFAYYSVLNERPRYKAKAPKILSACVTSYWTLVQ